MPRILTPLLVLALVFTTSVQAEEEPHYNRVRFQVEVAETVANDRMQAVLAAETEAASPAEVADAINRSMRWALEQSRAVPEIDASTGNYTITPVYRKDRPERWRGLQELRLEGRDFAALGELLGQLQQRLQIRNTRFTIADATREAVEKRLIDRAIARFKERAEQIRKQFNAERFLLVEANVNTGGGARPPQPVMRVQAMAAEAVTPPALEGGEGQVVVGVSGLIELE